MRPFFALLGLNFKRQLLTTFSFGNGKRKAATGALALVFLSVLMLFLSGTYSFSMGAMFSELGGLDLMLYVMLLLALLFPFIFTVFSAQSQVFSPKDMDLIFSLPVSHFSIMLSRVLALYLEILLMTELLALPAGIVYVLFGGAGGWATVVLIFLGSIFWALLPTLAGLIIGCLISLLSARMRHKNFFVILFSVLAMAAIFLLPSLLGGNMQTILVDIPALRGIFEGLFPPLTWFVWGAIGRPLYLLLLVLVCLVPFLLVVLLFSRFYKPLLSSLSSHRLQSNFKLGKVQASGSFAALLKKEGRKLLGSPLYLMNSCIGILMMVIVSVLALIKRDAVLGFLAEFGLGELLGPDTIAPILLGIVALLVLMVSTAAVSISLEGKYLWILKAAPISTARIFAAKAGLNFLLSAIPSVVCLVLLGITFSVAALPLVIITIIAVLFAALTAMLNLFCNLLFPRLDVENEAIIIKQSASMIVSMLANLVLIVILGGLFILLTINGLSFIITSIICSAVTAVLAVGMFVLLDTKGKRIFATL